MAALPCRDHRQYRQLRSIVRRPGIKEHAVFTIQLTSQNAHRGNICPSVYGHSKPIPVSFTVDQRFFPAVLLLGLLIQLVKSSQLLNLTNHWLLKKRQLMLHVNNDIDVMLRAAVLFLSCLLVIFLSIFARVHCCSESGYHNRNVGFFFVVQIQR